MSLLGDLNLSLAVQRNGVTGNVVYDTLALADEAYTKLESQVLTVANGVSDQVVSLGAVATASEVLLLSDQAVTLKLNGISTGLLTKALLLNGAAVTAMTISNASGSTATLRVYFLG